MADYFLDSSAVVKRYVNEPGSKFVDRLVDHDQGNNILIAQITTVEVSSALARRKKGMTLSEEDVAVALAALAKDLADIYVTVDLTPALIDSATDFAINHALRGFDAIQQATAFAANSDVVESGSDSLVFVSADNDLNSAAAAEGLKIENPNDYT